MKQYLMAASALGVLCLAPAAQADVLVVNPTQDTSIYQDNPGNANGAGMHFCTGSNGTPSPRRGLVQFDVSSIPAGSTINSVSIALNNDQVGNFAGAQTVSVHRLLTVWGEGASNQGVPDGGGFVAGVAPDATWNDSTLGTPWGTAGGDIVVGASQSAVVGPAFPAIITWTTNATLVADVQGWVDSPGTNFGWAWLGNESAVVRTAQRFETREGVVPPVLNIDFTGPPAAIPTMSEWGLALLGLILVAAGAFVIVRRTSPSAA